MGVKTIDHVALPIERVDAMLRFYEIFGFRIDKSLGPQLYSAHTTTQKLNFHAPELWKNPKFKLRSPVSRPGCGDLCFHWGKRQSDLLDLIAKHGIDLEEGPVSRMGGQREGMSTYVRDPDGNLVEFIVYPPYSEELPERE